MARKNSITFEKITEKIEFDILSGHFRPRERLIETDLMTQYKVSRGTIRKALKEIQFKQLIRHHSNRGAHVAEPTKREMEEIYEARVLLETNALTGVIENMDDYTLDLIKKYQKNFEKAVAEGKLSEIISANTLFHQTIFKKSGNDVIVEMIDQLRTRSHFWQHFIVGYPSRMENTIKGHSTIVKCIINGDQSSLISINKEHLRDGFEKYMEDLLRTQD